MYQFLQHDHDDSTVTPDAQVFGVAGEYKACAKNLCTR